MSFVGDLERLFAGLYPNRVPLAILGLVAAIGLTLLARRRGWFRIARRHPRASAAIAAAVLAAAIPTAWILGSPLFIRTELHEPPPSLAVASFPPAPSVVASPSAVPSTAVSPSPSPLVLRGMFVGADEFHTGRGTARIVETGPGTFVLRLDDFSVRNGPDLYVYLSPNPKRYAPGVLELGRLKASDGSFNYGIPAGIDVTRYQSVVIWCKAFSVQFASATLAAG